MMVGAGGNYHVLLPLSKRCFISFFQVPANPYSGSQVGEESLGQRYKANVQTMGTRFTFGLPKGVSGSGRAERWVSPELNLVVYLRGDDPRIGIVEYQLTEISLAEPGAGMFEVPEDYLAIPYTDSVAWRNPYALDLAAGHCGTGPDGE